MCIYEDFEGIEDEYSEDIEWDEMADTELGECYEEYSDEFESQELFDDIAEDLDIDDLYYLKEKVLEGDEDVLDVFGIKVTDEDEDEGFQKVLRR